MRDDILQQVKMEDIKHPDLRMVAELCGLSVALALFQKCAGVDILIAKNSLREFQEKYIIDNNNKYRAKELAIMLDMSERSVSQIISAARKVRKAKNKSDNSNPVNKQTEITLF